MTTIDRSREVSSLARIVEAVAAAAERGRLLGVVVEAVAGDDEEIIVTTPTIEAKIAEISCIASRRISCRFLDSRCSTF